VEQTASLSVALPVMLALLAALALAAPRLANGPPRTD
jgi:hypothetical protein